MTSAIKKQNNTGPTWNKPGVKLALKAMDPVDSVVRMVKGMQDMPKLSMRVRSNGIRGQFGGSKFHNEGLELLNLMQQHAGLTPGSKILEIGCGVGRTARHIAKYLEGGTYVGMDIEAVSLAEITNLLQSRYTNLSFQQLDIQNNLYNPGGLYSASEYEFPYEANSFDLIFHFSVFTHMLEEDVLNYIEQSAQLLKPGGVHCLSTFICGPNPDLESEKLPFSKGQARIQTEAMPEVAVGYSLEFYKNAFRESRMKLVGQPILGNWRSSHRGDIKIKFMQDVVIFKKL